MNMGFLINVSKIPDDMLMLQHKNDMELKADT